MGTPAPVTPSLSSKILAIINLVLQGLTLAVPGSAAAVSLGALLIHALAAYQAEVGQPIDLTKIPQEAQV
jgi:hypothetical protein